MQHFSLKRRITGNKRLFIRPTQWYNTCCCWLFPSHLTFLHGNWTANNNQIKSLRTSLFCIFFPLYVIYIRQNVFFFLIMATGHLKKESYCDYLLQILQHDSQFSHRYYNKIKWWSWWCDICWDLYQTNHVFIHL